MKDGERGGGREGVRGFGGWERGRLKKEGIISFFLCISFFHLFSFHNLWLCFCFFKYFFSSFFKPIKSTLFQLFHQYNHTTPHHSTPHHTTPHHTTPHHTTPHHTTPHHTTPHHTRAYGQQATRQEFQWPSRSSSLNSLETAMSVPPFSSKFLFRPFFSQFLLFFLLKFF